MKTKSLFLISTVFLFLFQVSAFAQIGSAGKREGFALFIAKDNDKTATTRQRVVETEQPNSLPSIKKPVTTFDLERKAFELLNRQRAENNLSPLVWSDDVAKIARVHSENMAKHKFFSHQGLDGTMVNDRADSLGISKWRSIGENIAYNLGYQNPVEFAVERWMSSPSHRGNILNNRWQESAVGVAISKDGAYYFTQVFLLRK
ncbi:MAG TPA: CAP domain-containing protein [Pyrinomonadaceae bacterium]|nr:CAP domain-containing protein [Pyrinomonadaceae bacterium]